MTKEILGATIRSQVFIVAIILGNLKQNKTVTGVEMNNTCVLTLILQLLVTVEVPEPMLKASSLHMSDESMYTNQTCTSNIVFPISFYKNLLCSPEFVPQIVGGALFPGVVTLKMSVWHWPFSNILLPPILVTDVVAKN